jgi:O-antigen ligase
MKQDRSIFFQSLNLPSSWNNWLLALFLGLAIFTGGAAAIAGAQFGWVVLLAIPVLFFVLAILIQPELGLAAFVFIVYIQLNLVLAKYRPGIPSPALLLLGALIFLIIWRMVIYGDRPVGWKRTSIILVVVTGWLFSVLVAENSTLALLKLQKFLENAILAFVVVFFVQKPNSFRKIIWTLLLAGIFMASISVFQSLTSTYGNNYWGFGGWNEATTAGTSNHRLTGPYGNPNGYAQVLVLLVPLALDRLWHEKNFQLRLLAGYALAVCALTIFFTYSRNGFLTLVFTLGFLVVMRRPRIMPLALSVAIGVILIQFLPASYTQRITTLFQFSSSAGSRVSDASFQGRISENIAAWRMFQDHPVFGVGLDNFQVNYQTYSRKIGLDSRRDPRAPASFYLELLSEQGLIGFSIFIVFMVVIFRNLWRARELFELLEMKTEECMSLAFMSGLAGYMVFYISKNSAYPNVFWILLGIAFSIPQVAENSAHALRSESRGLQ